MSDQKKPTDYKVGYGKPPKSTQFKKGKSGNPKGRPKKKKAELPKTVLQDIWREILMDEVTVRKSGKTEKMTKYAAYAERLAIEAMEGNHKARSEVRHVLKDLGMATPIPSEEEKQVGGVLVVNGKCSSVEEFQKKYGGRRKTPSLDDALKKSEGNKK